MTEHKPIAEFPAHSWLGSGIPISHTELKAEFEALLAENQRLRANYYEAKRNEKEPWWHWSNQR